uniref:Gelsolin-like domain-containing protein n=1 Tax=Acrobeloides nanus TaxID=290746 RepID=A0A914CHP2_9BILA
DSKTIKRLLDEVYGQFYDSECYLILKTYGTPAYSWDIHFWLGSKSSTDLQTVAAYRATDLDKYLNLKAKQFREIQNHESPAFLALFKDKIRYLAGEKHSIIRASSKKHFKKRLYLVKGKRNCDVFILDADEKIFVWNGPHSNNGEKIRGAEMARNIRDFERAGRATIEFIDDEWDSHAEFFTLLGAKPSPPVSKSDETDEEFEYRTIKNLKLFRVSDASGQLQMTEVQPPLSRNSLDSNDCFFLNLSSSGIYAWVGKNCTLQEKEHVWILAQKYLHEQILPSYTPICKFHEGNEPAIFRAALNWPVEPLKLKLNQAKNSKNDHEIDLHSMHIRATKLATDLPDDGKGLSKVWRIGNFALHTITELEKGIFYSGDSYIVFYKSHKVYNGIVYFWLGSQSSRDEQAAAAMFVHHIDEQESKGKAMQIRIVQGKEPEHFRRIFGDLMIILKGGNPSGFKSARELERKYEEHRTSVTKLFQVRDKKAIQIEKFMTSTSRVLTKQSTTLPKNSRSK